MLNTIQSKLILALLLTCSTFAQSVELTVASDGPAPVNNVSGGFSGAREGITYWYWIVARYPVGDATAYGPLTLFNGPATLSVSDFAIITWNSLQGATSYAVLRSTSAVSPLSNNACAACLVGTTTGTSINDTGTALTSFTRVPNPGRVSTQISLNNRDYPTPVLRLGDYFPWQSVGVGLLADRPTQCVGLRDMYTCSGADCPNTLALYYCTASNTWSLIAAGGGIPGNPDRSVQFNDSGSFAGDSRFLFTAGGVVQNENGYEAGDGATTGAITLLRGSAPSAPPNVGDRKFWVDTNDFVRQLPDSGTSYWLMRSLAQLNCSIFANGGLLTTDANGNSICADRPGAGSGVTYLAKVNFTIGVPVSFSGTSLHAGCIVDSTVTMLGGTNLIDDGAVLLNRTSNEGVNCRVGKITPGINLASLSFSAYASEIRDSTNTWVMGLYAACLATGDTSVTFGSQVGTVTFTAAAGITSRFMGEIDTTVDLTSDCAVDEWLILRVQIETAGSTEPGDLQVMGFDVYTN